MYRPDKIGPNGPYTKPAGGCLGFFFGICVILYVVFGMLWMFIKEHIGVILLAAFVIGILWYRSKMKKAVAPTLLETISRNKDRFCLLDDCIFMDLNSLDLSDPKNGFVSGTAIGYQRVQDNEDKKKVWIRCHSLSIHFKDLGNNRKQMVARKFFSIIIPEGSVDLMTIDTSEMLAKIWTSDNKREWITETDDSDTLDIVNVDSDSPVYKCFHERYLDLIKNNKYSETRFNKERYNRFRQKFYNEKIYADNE